MLEVMHDVPSVAEMLPKNNKSTALADNSIANSGVAFILPGLPDFGIKPPPRDSENNECFNIDRSVHDVCAAELKAHITPSLVEAGVCGLGVQHIPNGGQEAMRRFGSKMIEKHGLEDNFYAIDLGRLELLYKTFRSSMPRVHPFYAVKCNPDAGMLRLLAALGSGFDCASAQEMQVILEAGVDAERIVFAQPCKRPACLKYAVENDVLKMTFDSEDELLKIRDKCPHAQLLLRIKADDLSAVVQFGHKYGASPYGEAGELLRAAKRLDLDVVGVSFHVGSGSQSAAAYNAAIAAARHVFDEALRAGLPPLRLLDIGGGFVGRFAPDGAVQLHEVAACVNAALALHFPPCEGVAVIAEPGRFFAEACATLFCMVHTVKDVRGASAPAKRSYFITDGVYGSFNGVIYDHASIQARVLRSPGLPTPDQALQRQRVPATVFGPTCDGVDLIFKDVPMPLLRRGDWLQFPDMGAYALAGACAFNGLPVDAPAKFYVWSRSPVDQEAAHTVIVKRGDDDASLMSSTEACCTPETQLSFFSDLHHLDSIV